MNQEQKKAKIIERAITFTGLKQVAARELASKAHKLSIRQLRRVIGATQRDLNKGLLLLKSVAPDGNSPQGVRRRESRQTTPTAA